MSRWAVLGSGGFVSGSLLPFAPAGVIKGLITHRPSTAVGLAAAYNLTQYESVRSARKDGVDTVFIASTSETHLRLIEDSIDAGVEQIICEKPVITSSSQLDRLEQVAAHFSGAMIKRGHRHISFDDHIEFSILADVDDGQVADPNTGGMLMNELIHYIDIAIGHTGPSGKWQISGNRRCGELYRSSASQSVRIKYDFKAGASANPLPFYGGLIPPLFQVNSPVIIPGTELIRLYEESLDIQRHLLGQL